MNRHAIGAAMLAAVAVVFLALPGTVFAQDADDETTETAVTEVPTSTEDPPAEIPLPEESTEPPAPVETTESAEPADTGEESPEPAAPAPAGSADTGGAPSPSEGYSAPATDVDRPVADEAAGLQPTGYSSPSGVEKREPNLARVHVDAGSSSGSDKTSGGASCRRTDVGEVGDNGEVHGSLGGCQASQISITDLDDPVTVGGVTFTFTLEDTPNGEVLHFTTDVPFTGSLFVKGGPNHFQCDFSAVTEGTCHAPVNTNPPSDPYFDFSHVDVCVGKNPELPPGTPPGENGGGNLPGGGGGGQGPGDNGPDDDQGVEDETPEEGVTLPGVTPAGVPVATAAPAGEALPFTGLDPAWLVLLGAGLLVGGVLVRRQAS